MSMCQRRYTLFNSKDFHAIVSKNKYLLQNKENKRKKERINEASRQIGRSEERRVGKECW